MADYVDLWDCPGCGKEGLSGLDRFCPACGAACTGAWYFDENAKPITDPEALKIARGGRNWVCEACESDNRNSAKFCTQCGAEKGTKFRPVVKYDLDEMPLSEAEVKVALEERGLVDYSGDAIDPHYHGEGSSNEASQEEHLPSILSEDDSLLEDVEEFVEDIVDEIKAHPKRSLLGLLGFLLLFSCLLSGFWFFQPITVQATVDQLTWERSIHIEQYRTVHKEGWSTPSDARNVSREWKQSGTKQVHDHYETRTRTVQTGTRRVVCGRQSNGNGTSSDVYCTEPVYGQESYQHEVTRTEPVYDWWYKYDVDRWVHSRDIATNGFRGNPDPYWGDFTLQCGGREQRIGCERESGREDHYVIIFAYYDGDERKTHRMEDSRSDWDMYEFDREYTVVFNRTGQTLNDPLRPDAD